MSARPELPQVVYIAGYGRSGSTVLDVLLGSLEQVAAVGELFMFFRPGETRDCSCGQSVADCPFWSETRRRYQQATGVAPEDARGLAFRARVEGLLAPLRSWFGRSLRAEYAEHQQALLSAAAASLGRTTIVDSSKTAHEVAWRPGALQRAGVRVKLIHLIRDGRAVMWSVMRGCNRKLERGDADPRLSFPRLRAAIGWTLANGCAWLGRWRLPSEDSLAVSYEALARNPSAELARIGQFLRLDMSPVIARLEARETAPPGHSISGNRLRHAGVAEIREDDAWRTALPLSARALYWLIAGPAHLAFVRDAAQPPAQQAQPGSTITPVARG